MRVLTILSLAIFAYVTTLSAELVREDDIVYDSVNNVTWLLDANYIVTSEYIDTIRGGSREGYVTWDQATTWVESLDISGGTSWRLPIDDDEVLGYNVGGELGTMFYDHLGNNANEVNFSNIAIDDDGAPITFSNIQRTGYWTGTTPSYGTNYRWVFHFTTGASDYVFKDAPRAVWPIHDGDLRTVKTTWGGETVTWQGELGTW